MTWQELIKLEYKDFKEWLAKLDTQECFLYDWNIMINGQQGAQGVRNSFCSFANIDGGIIFVGVDNQKNMIGVDEDSELRTRVDQIISSGIFPPIPTLGWDIKSIKISRKKKYIYCIGIFPSPFYTKPHITENKIYKRGNGRNIPLHDGTELRSLFLLDRFDPKDIKHLEQDLNKLKNVRFEPDHIDVLYLKLLKEYIEAGCQSRDTSFVELLKLLKDIIALYESVKKKEATGVTGGDGLSIIDNQSVLDDCAQLSNKVVDFINRYKAIHKL
jgi:predicted HTH transcriptional regulator